VSVTQTATDNEGIAQDWVARFTEAWREPRGPDAFIEQCRGLLAPDVRESYFDPSPLIAAVAITPRAWPRFLRRQARNLTNHLADNLSRRRRR
jgi:hypothetical protein